MWQGDDQFLQNEDDQCLQNESPVKLIGSGAGCIKLLMTFLITIL